MTTKTVLILGALGYVAYKAMETYNTVQQITFNLEKVKYDKSNSNAFHSKLLVTLNIVNPTRNEIALDAFVGVLKIKGQLITTMNVQGSNTPITFPQGSTPMTVEAVVDHIGLLNSLPGIVAQFTSGNLQDLVDLTGTLYAGGISIPINTSINLSF